MAVFGLWMIYVVGILFIQMSWGNDMAILWALMWILYELMKISDKMQ